MMLNTPFHLARTSDIYFQCSATWCLLQSRNAFENVKRKLFCFGPRWPSCLSDVVIICWKIANVKILAVTTWNKAITVQGSYMKYMIHEWQFFLHPCSKNLAHPRTQPPLLIHEKSYWYLVYSRLSLFTSLMNDPCFDHCGQPEDCLPQLQLNSYQRLVESKIKILQWKLPK